MCSATRETDCNEKPPPHAVKTQHSHKQINKNYKGKENGRKVWLKKFSSKSERLFNIQKEEKRVDNSGKSC